MKTSSKNKSNREKTRPVKKNENDMFFSETSQDAKTSEIIQQQPISNSPHRVRNVPSSPIKNLEITLKESEKKDEDWDYRAAYHAGYLGYKRYSNDLEETAVPPKINLYEKYSWWDVSNQGSSYSCVGWAVTDVVYWHFVRDGVISSPKKKLSARFTWMAAKEIDSLIERPTTFIEREGTTLKAALKVCYHYGAVPDDLLPTNIKESASYHGLYQGGADSFYAIATRYKITSYFNLFISKNEERKHQAILWQRWLWENGPIIIRIKTDRNWDNPVTKRLDDYQHPSSGSHAAIIVGYQTDEQGNVIFTVRNSKGKDWGNQGYIDMTTGYALDAIDEAYGIVTNRGGVGNPGGSKNPLPCALFPC